MSNFFTPLHQDALLHISGPDTLKFLQGQVTCDTGQVSAEQAVTGAYCTPQGRVVCDFLLCQLEEEQFALRLRREIRDGSAAVFGKYIIFSKAELEASSDEWQLFGCWGPQAATLLRETFGSTPAGPHAAFKGDGCMVIQVDDQGTRFECYLHSATAPRLAEQLADHFEAAQESSWQCLDIDAGIARIQSATVEEFVPQMLNYDLNGYVNFNKGCYTGQEVIARLHYRGTPKRRLYPAILPAACEARPGDPLFGASGEQSIGNLVNIATGEGGVIHALAVIAIAAVDEGVHLDAPGASSIRLQEPPYPL